MQSQQIKPLAQRLRLEARKIFTEHDENTRLLYSTERCQQCGAHLTIRQLNRIIIQGVPPLCLKHYKLMMGQMDELKQLFGQLRLY